MSTNQPEAYDAILPVKDVGVHLNCGCVMFRPQCMEWGDVALIYCPTHKMGMSIMTILKPVLDGVTTSKLIELRDRLKEWRADQ